MSLAGQSLWSSSDSGQDLLHHLLLLLSGGSLWTPLWQPCVCILLANLSGRDTPPIHTPAAEAVKLFTSICTGQTGRAFSHWPPPKQASLSHGMFLSNGAHVEWYSSTYTTGRCTHWAGQSRKLSVRLTGKKPKKQAKRDIWLSWRGCSRAVGPLFWWKREALNVVRYSRATLLTETPD